MARNGKFYPYSQFNLIKAITPLRRGRNLPSECIDLSCKRQSQRQLMQNSLTTQTPAKRIHRNHLIQSCG